MYPNLEEYAKGRSLAKTLAQMFFAAQQNRRSSDAYELATWGRMKDVITPDEARMIYSAPKILVVLQDNGTTTLM